MENDGEAKLQRQKDSRGQDIEKSKRKVESGTVTAGSEVTLPLLKDLLATQNDNIFIVAIGIENHTGLKWRAPTVYFRSGTAGSKLPYCVDAGKAVFYQPYSDNDKGLKGVLTYFLPTIQCTIAVMFHNPSDHSTHINRWNVKLYYGNVVASDNMYVEMYNSSSIGGDGHWHDGDLAYRGMHFRGSMNNFSQATLGIYIFKN